jgi:hypothetical protein
MLEELQRRNYSAGTIRLYLLLPPRFPAAGAGNGQSSGWFELEQKAIET